MGCSKDLSEDGSHSALKMLEDFDETSSSLPRAVTGESRKSVAVPSLLVNHVESSTKEVPSSALSSTSPFQDPSGSRPSTAQEPSLSLHTTAEDTSSISSVPLDLTAHHERSSSASLPAGDISKPIEAGTSLEQLRLQFTRRSSRLCTRRTIRYLFRF